MVTPEVSLGIDIGTGSTKAGLVSDDGLLLAVGRCTHEIEEPKTGWSETDPAAWMVSVGAAIAEVFEKAAATDLDPQVVTVGLSGQMHGAVVTDRSSAPLRPAVLWSDRRSQPYLDGLRAALDVAFDGETKARLANPVVAGMAGPTIAALRRQEADVMAKAAVLLQPKDWVRWQLTGALATDPSDASATLLWDIAEDRWSPEACEVFGVDPAWLPPVKNSAAVAGHLEPEIASIFGLVAGTPVATGAADTAAALLGAGIAPGETQVSTGTGGQIAQLTATRQIDRTGRTHLFRAAGRSVRDEPRWYAMAAMQNVGIAIDWARSLLAIDQQELDSIMTAEGTADLLEQAATVPVVFRPYLTGERTPHLDATLTGGFEGLRPSTTRTDLIRAVFTGVAAAMGDGRSALSAAGYTLERALLAGGGSLQPWWRQLLADQLQMTLVPHDVPDASVRGAGLLGWAAVGHVIDSAEGVERQTEVYEPKPLVDGQNSKPM